MDTPQQVLKRQSSIQFQVLLFPDDGHWFAWGLDFDIAGSGKTIREAQRSFMSATVIQIQFDLEDDVPLFSRNKLFRLV